MVRGLHIHILIDFMKKYNFLICIFFSSHIWNSGIYCRSKQFEYHEKTTHNQINSMHGKLEKITSEHDEHKLMQSNESSLITDPNIIIKNIALLRYYYKDIEPATFLNLNVISILTFKQMSFTSNEQTLVL